MKIYLLQQQKKTKSNNSKWKDLEYSHSKELITRAKGIYVSNCIKQNFRILIYERTGEIVK